MQNISYVVWIFNDRKKHLFLRRLCVIIGKCEVCDVTGVSARNTWLFKSFTINTWSLLYFVLKSWWWFRFWFWTWDSVPIPTPTLVKDSIPVEVFHQITRKMRLKRGWDVFTSKIERRPHHKKCTEYVLCGYENFDLCEMWPTTWGEVKNGAMLLLAVICALYLSFKVF